MKPVKTISPAKPLAAPAKPPGGSIRTCSPLVLEVKGIGHCPSAKNSFHAIVDPKYREWKRKCVALFVSQCFTAMQTTGQGICPTDLKEFLMRSLPADDNCFCIAEIGSVRWEKVPKGQQGAVVTIEPL